MVRPANSDEDEEEEAAVADALRALARRGGMLADVRALLGRVRVGWVRQTAESVSEAAAERLAEWTQ